MNFPIGYDNFRDVVDEKLDFVDKSLLIKEFIDDKGTQVALITRPRRFAKTFNLTMLHNFFAPHVYGKPTKDLFNGLQIAEQGQQYMQHQGKYPVVALTFKDVKDGEFKSAYASLEKLLSRAYHEHIAVLEGSKLTNQQKRNFGAVLNEQADEATIKTALFDLTHCLYQHYGEKAIVLIDEYDTPIQSGYVHGYYNKVVEVMRHLFSAGLKSNPYLYRAMLTGILRVSKESLFSGLNNLKVYSVLNSKYSEYFGFTEDEVDEILKKSQLSHQAADIKQWYNGYQFGEITVYNPWSIVNCVAEQGTLKPYWVNTSDNRLIKNLMIQSNATFKEEFEALLQGQPVKEIIDENFVFSDLDTNESAIWSLLLFSGYLNAKEAVFEGTKVKCTLLPPNQEIVCLYKDTINEWFTDHMGQGRYYLFLKNLVEGKVDDFGKMLKQFLLETASLFDVKGKNPEKFYHGFVLGLVASLEKTHIVKSNHESGFGRYDVMLIPKDTRQLGIVLEFKSVDDKGKNLEDEAREALKQITERKYELELHQMKISSILKIGLAFRGKDVGIASDRADLELMGNPSRSPK